MSYHATPIEGTLYPKSLGDAKKVMEILKSHEIDASLTDSSEEAPEICVYKSANAIRYDVCDYDEIADIVHAGSFIHFLGEGSDVFAVILGDGKIDDPSGEILWDHKEGER